MAHRKLSASETKARDLGLALARIAESEGLPAAVGVDRLRQASPRLTPLAVGQMVRKHQDLVDATLAERGLSLADYADQGPGLGMTFTIEQA